MKDDTIALLAICGVIVAFFVGIADYTGERARRDAYQSCIEGENGEGRKVKGVYPLDTGTMIA